MHISVWSPIKMYIAYRLLHRSPCNSAHSAHFHWYPLKISFTADLTYHETSLRSLFIICLLSNFKYIQYYRSLISGIWYESCAKSARATVCRGFLFKRLPFQLWFVNGFFLIVAICFMNVKSSNGLMLYKVTSKNLMSAKMGSARHLRSATSCCTSS